MAELFRPAYIKNYDIEITQLEDFVLGLRVKPRNDQDVLYLEDTTGYSAIFSLHADSATGEEIFTVDTVTGNVTLGFTPPKWEAATVYGLGEKVVPTVLNGYVYECVVAGTSFSSEPTWPTTIGDTEPDDTLSWRCETDDSQVCNVFIHLGTDVTGTLEPWGRGYYTLTVKDTFTHSWLHIDGAAYLRETATGTVG